jgi:hypothetical protein
MTENVRPGLHPRFRMDVEGDRLCGGPTDAGAETTEAKHRHWCPVCEDEWSHAADAECADVVALLCDNHVRGLYP